MPAPDTFVSKETLVRMRRDLHAIPELSLVEYETAAYIEAVLDPLGFDEIRTGVAGTGILATLRGAKPGPVTLLRADMDALPIVEMSDVPYRSRRDGVMHACGHDGHVSILLGAARTLAARRHDIGGTLVFCFQPGEEGSAGNRLMIEAGALEAPHVERAFALHLYSGLDVGKIGVRDGAFLPSSDRFTLELFGSGGHGAMPDRACDPIVAASHIVAALQTIVSREIAPKDPVVVTVGAINAGTTFNVIPEVAVLKGTVRCFDATIRAELPARFERIVAGLCAALRVTYRLHYLTNYPMTVNDRRCNAVIRGVGASVLGAHCVIEHDVVMMAEDMSFMHERVAGGYFIVGTHGGAETAYPNHNARFDIDEDALVVGHRMMVGLGLSGAAC